MTDHIVPDTHDYLAQRLDGARDLYLLALRLGEREDGGETFGSLIREARIHFVSVLEEARTAGLDTSEISVMLGQERPELRDSIRPELWDRLAAILPRRTTK